MSAARGGGFTVNLEQVHKFAVITSAQRQRSQVTSCVLGRLYTALVQRRNAAAAGAPSQRPLSGWQRRKTRRGHRRRAANHRLPAAKVHACLACSRSVEARRRLPRRLTRSAPRQRSRHRPRKPVLPLLLDGPPSARKRRSRQQPRVQPLAPQMHTMVCWLARTL